MMIRANFDIGIVIYDAIEAMDTALVSGYEPENVKQEWRVFLPPAAIWILLAGQKMRELCLVGYRNAAPAPERWNVWKEKFSTLATTEELDVNCRTLATKAVERMREIESQ